MGFMDTVRGIISKFRATGKSEKEISSIIETAAEKATVNKSCLKKDEFIKKGIKVESTTEFFRRTFSEMGITTEQVNEAICRIGYSQEREKCRKTNNWRKMHGLPMKRKQKARKRNGKRKRADCHRQNAVIS